MRAFENCPDCIEYAEARVSVLTPAFVERREVTGETAQQIIDRYMSGVHTRHLAGLPILEESA